MRAAKGRLEVVQSVFIRQIDDGEPQRHLRAFGAQKVVSAHAQIEHMTRCDSRRIGVVIRRTVGWEF